MKEDILNVVNQYLIVFPTEKERQSRLIIYLEKSSDEEIIDWNNFNGHIVASGFVFAKREKMFLFLYHNDMKSFVYPGGHVDIGDKNVLEAAMREVKEETGLNSLKEIKVSENKLVPFDIDTHVIAYNERLNLPEHYHFDFRYIFMIDNISDVKLDISESSSYKWIGIDEVSHVISNEKVVKKIVDLIKK